MIQSFNCNCLNGNGIAEFLFIKPLSHARLFSIRNFYFKYKPEMLIALAVSCCINSIPQNSLSRQTRLHMLLLDAASYIKHFGIPTSSTKFLSGIAEYSGESESWAVTGQEGLRLLLDCFQLQLTRKTVKASWVLHSDWKTEVLSWQRMSHEREVTVWKEHCLRKAKVSWEWHLWNSQQVSVVV